MKQIVFILAVVVALTLSSSTQEEESFFKRVIAKDYGRTLLTTIFLEMKQDGPVERIETLLSSMLETLEADKISGQSAIEEREATCKQTIDDIDVYIERVSTNKADNEKQLPLKEEQIQDKKEQVQERQEELSRNKASIQKLFATRQEEHKEFAERREEMTQLVNALQEAKGIISQLKGGSFLQTTVLTQLKAHHTKIGNLFPQRNAFKTLAKILMEITSDSKVQADPETVQVIIDVIDELIESIYQVQKQEMFTDDERTKFYQKDVQRLQQENTRLQNSNTYDLATLEHLTNRYNDLVTNIAAQTLILDSKQTEREDWVGSGADERNSFNQIEALRDEQIETLKQVQSLVQNNFDGVRDIINHLMV